ncbi:RagB/SusD family nutrient uptake outer membrane protein [Adhaeribacter rhizoryzae]|uniref:RagB/SusD family nutrient uptake outer membrane protein n=1 Tax=Adhaeribacter rhizoryzae TaxID=2607907 RepID=A0A5M6D666_9BACT|nr:RagB/SusD family nutrient uptake outer membrane protein [Adhaeribacter rhizoryzae]KAA5542998.1 RagB/SusD family nutrient uptake outer membrane protein [Adhaeribacter rhizoryzae]
MKSLKYIIAFSLTLPLGACEKLLDVQPKSAISDTQTIVDKASAETALRGVYSALADGSYYGTGFQSIGYLSGDNVQWTGSQSQVQEFINHKVNADNATISSAWTAIYRTINRANNVLAKVPQVATNVTFSETLRNQIIGEAYFIRALAYFDLARTWGGVPIITNPTQSPTENWNIPKSTAAETYAQVIADLDLAEPLLPETTNRFQATRKTVWALKARYFLYQQDYAKAEEYASKLIGDAANYQLLKPYNAFFANNARGTQESVFEIFYSATETNAHRNQWQPQTNGGTRQWAPNSTLVDLLNNPLTGGSRSALIAKDNQNRWYGNLYYRSPATDPSFVIRVAELYLIRAEARAQQGNITGALADLNAVRDRAELLPLEAFTTEEILLAIENEHRLEFAFEPHRWYDLVRTGRAQEVLQVTDTKRLVMPIPAEQLLIDPGLTQNDGY